MSSISEECPLLTFSHLRWDFVFQRPQHLLSRYAVHRPVYYFEEPMYGMADTPRIHIKTSKENVKIVVPHLPKELDAKSQNRILTSLVDELINQEGLDDLSLWYYTPMALPFSRHLEANTTIYDCMDELSNFRFAPPELLDLEKELMGKADLVFTGGQSLFEAKRHRHANIFPFPSSIDFRHFAQARVQKQDPLDQAKIPHPRVGFFGVVDERMNLELLEGMAKLRPDWQFVIIGPVIKIDETLLPRLSNIHYLGKKDYTELPYYLSGWDLAIMPFALNDSTKFISPTKTPEYLAAGRAVVSTSIRDVVNPYGNEKLVYIADTPEEFIDAAEKAMWERQNDPEWILKVDEFLDGNSWDMTWRRMASLEKAILRKRASRAQVRIQIEPDRYSNSIGL